MTPAVALMIDGSMMPWALISTLAYWMFWGADGSAAVAVVVRISVGVMFAGFVGTVVFLGEVVRVAMRGEVVGGMGVASA